MLPFGECETNVCWNGSVVITIINTGKGGIDTGREWEGFVENEEGRERGMNGRDNSLIQWFATHWSVDFMIFFICLSWLLRCIYTGNQHGPIRLAVISFLQYGNIKVLCKLRVCVTLKVNHRQTLKDRLQLMPVISTGASFFNFGSVLGIRLI